MTIGNRVERTKANETSEPRNDDVFITTCVLAFIKTVKKEKVGVIFLCALIPKLHIHMYIYMVSFALSPRLLIRLWSRILEILSRRRKRKTQKIREKSSYSHSIAFTANISLLLSFYFFCYFCTRHFEPPGNKSRQYL